MIVYYVCMYCVCNRLVQFNDPNDLSYSVPCVNRSLCVSVGVPTFHWDLAE